MTQRRSAPATPTVPDWSVVTAPVARQALEGILAAGHYDSRFGNLDPAAARVLACVLRLYASLGRAPTMPEVAVAAGMPAPAVARELALLRERDLVLLDAKGGAIVGAYPFTEAVTGHRVTYAGTGRTLAAMCAIDALGAGAMCRDDATVRSACGSCGAVVAARTDDRGMTLKEVMPAGAVVWVGLRQSHGCAANSLCAELLFFCADEHLARWRTGRGAGTGYRLSPAEAFQVAKALFIDRAMMERG